MYKYPTPDMPIRVIMRTDDGQIHHLEAIEHEDGIWIVNKWLPTTYGNTRRPARIIRVDKLAHDFVSDLFGKGERVYTIRDPLPRGVLDGATWPQLTPPLQVEEEPDLLVRNTR